MEKVYIDKINKIETVNIIDNEEVFGKILQIRKENNLNNKFFLNYISDNILKFYNLNNKESIKMFHHLIYSLNTPIQGMGGANLNLSKTSSDEIEISDPEGIIKGVFIYKNKSFIYSPIFPLIYKEKGINKFANDYYFTSITFKEILERLIDNSEHFYIHKDNYQKTSDIIKYGNYVYEEVMKDDFINYTNDYKEGEKVLKKYNIRNYNHL